MAIASDKQVQSYSDQRVRPRAEQARSLIAAFRDDEAAIGDVYAACAQQSPTWTDSRMDGPPVLLTPQTILVFNSVAVLLLKCIDGTATAQDVANLSANWSVFQSACVRPIGTITLSN